jgi:NhaP-type Na+/H+ or K+/H+ antiporter
LLRRRDLSASAFQALRLESGLNDAVLLPIVLVAIVLQGGGSLLGSEDWARLGLDLFLLGPGAGVAVGLLAVATLELVRRRIGVRRDYESLYSLGVAFAAYAGAEALHGSGFLAAFTAGLTISALDVELCDCFLEYGETTAEMALLFTFVLLGSSLIWSGLKVLSGETLLFALIVLLARPIAFLASLAGTRLDWRSRLIIAWFGPRGLSSLLLVLLPVFAGLPGSERLFAICCLVVLLSVTLHGGSLMLLGRATPEPRQVRPAPEFGGLVPLPQEVSRATPSAEGDPVESTSPPDRERISVEEFRRLEQSGAAVLLLDVRSDRSYDASDLQIRGAIRLQPDHAVRGATELNLPRHAWLALFCA